VPRLHAPLLTQSGLQLLRVLQMCDECRTDFHEERLQSGVLRMGDQGLVDGVNDGLVVHDFVGDIGFIESCAG